MATVITYPQFPHVEIVLDGENKRSTESCSRCGQVDVVTDPQQVILNALAGGSLFVRKHWLECGEPLSAEVDA